MAPLRCAYWLVRLQTLGSEEGRLAVSGNVSAVVSRIRRATIFIRVQPRARSNALAALRAGVLIVRVMAPPLDGRANDAVCRLLARALGVRASDVTILRGERTRDKVVAIDGVDQAAADAAVRVAVNR
jgi:uncharacterized protein (TIGR00251 family)